MEQRSLEEDDPRDPGDPQDDPAAAPYHRRSIASSVSDIASVFNDENTTATEISA